MALCIQMHKYLNKPFYLPHLAMTGSRNSRWRSSKPKVSIFQLVEELTTRFQIIILCFRGQAIQWRHAQHYHTTAEVGIQDGGHLNRKYLYFSLLRRIKRRIKHIRSVVHHPSTNGQAENFVKRLKNALKSAKYNGGTVKHKLARFLLAYRNAPHSVTAVTPATLFLGRPLRTRIVGDQTRVINSLSS